MHRIARPFRTSSGISVLQVQNLMVFCQTAEGIDETTWMYHLRRGDYSRWFRDAIKDDYLADETERGDLAPWQARQMIQER
ncbi:MAG TPA: hypothetical protein PLQ95_13325 [Thiobacillus sp.]|nr:hypothetical protein [Thiobacillus sp.]